MSFKEICNLFFYWFGFCCFFVGVAVLVVMAYDYIEYKIRIRKMNSMVKSKYDYDAVEEVHKILKQKI